MSDPSTSPAPAPGKADLSGAGPSRGWRMALAVSLALNLAVGGFVLGHALSDGGPWRRGPHGSTVRDVGFGPMTEALNPADRTLLRDRLFARAPELREARRRTEADLAAQVAALSAQPFDEAALRAAFEAQHQHMAANLALAHEALIDFLVALPPEARLALAERLATRIGTAP